MDGFAAGPPRDMPCLAAEEESKPQLQHPNTPADMPRPERNRP